MTIIAKLAKEKLREIQDALEVMDIEDLNEVQSDLEAEAEGWPDDSESEEAAEDSEDSDESEEAEDTGEEQEAENEDVDSEESDESDLIGINEAEELLKPYGLNKKMIYYRIDTGKMLLPEKRNGRFIWHKKELQEWAEKFSKVNN